MQTLRFLYPMQRVAQGKIFFTRPLVSQSVRQSYFFLFWFVSATPLKHLNRNSWKLCFLFVWFFVLLENFSLIRRYNHCRWGRRLQILTYARHSWPLTWKSSEGSLTCHTYCDKGHPFIMVISGDPWHLRLLPSVYQWNYQYLFLRLLSGDRCTWIVKVFLVLGEVISWVTGLLTLQYRTIHYFAKR